MPVLRRRARKMVRKKYKKTVKLSEVNDIWNTYVEYGLVKPLLRLGKVQAGGMTIEIVGTKIVDDPKFGLLVKGLNINKVGGIKKAVRFDDNRPDVKYKIMLTDKNYCGNLIFQADPKLSLKVHNELKNTRTYYRIE